MKTPIRIMQTTIRLLFSFLLLSGFQPADTSCLIKTTAPVGFGLNEHLSYHVHYGWFEAGVVDMVIDSQLHTVNDRPCYKIDVSGESRALLYVFLKVKNHFCSYLDTERFLPQMFYRDIQEGKYTKKEKMIFDHAQGKVYVEKLSPDTGEVINKESFTIGTDIQDILSAWYVLRNVDFSTIQVGDVLYSPIFFDNILYEKFQTKFLGRRTIKTKLGAINALVLAPVVTFSKQGNSVFAGENSVELFLSDDANKIPIKIKAKLLVGAIEIDLINYKNLQYPLAIQKKKK